MTSPSTSSTSIVTENVVAFLGKVPPFEFLPASEIRRLARTITLEYVPKDTVILSVTARLWQKMIAKFQVMKVHTLGDALRIGKA